MNKKVVVFGTTAKAGGKKLRQLEKCEIQHSAFVRKGSEDRVESKNTEILFGNVLNAEELENIFQTNEFTDVAKYLAISLMADKTGFSSISKTNKV